MRILMVHNFYIKPGGESTVYEQDREILRAKGHEVIEYTRSNLELEKMRRSDKYLTGFKMVYSRSSYQQVLELIKKIKPDVALIQNVYPLITPSVYYALSKNRVPIVQLVHQHRFVCVNAQLYVQGDICERCTGGNFLHSIPRKCYRNSFLETAIFASTLWLHHRFRTFSRLIDAFIVPDEFTRVKLKEIGLSSDKIFINTNPYEPPKKEPDQLTENYFVYIGRLEPHKGPLTLVRAMSNVKSNIKLHIVGEGILQAEIENEILKRGLVDRVELSPPIWGNEFQQLIGKGKFVVVPSEWYDDGVLIPYYAFGHGKPVIASKIHGLIEEVDHEINGLLFEKGNSLALAEAINRLSTDEALRASLGRNARKKAVEQLGIDLHYKTMMEIIKYAIDKRNLRLT